MPTVINDKRMGTSPLPSVLLDILPVSLTDELERRRAEAIERGRAEHIEEIRCRLFKPSFITCGGKNLPLEHVTLPSQMEKMLDAVCGGSFYAHRDTLINGYVTLDGGVRVGICGRAAMEKGNIIGIFDITSLNFRIPSPPLSVGERVETLIRQGGGGVLIYSPAGEGKTTLLRSLISRLSSGDEPLRVCVVDTRGEISAVGGEGGECADMLIGYPKSHGIEIATRTMNAQLIVCDEIGGAEEAKAILEAQNCGIPLLATTHGRRLSDILRREGIRSLHLGGVFESYVGITRRQGGGEFIYRIADREAADECL